MVSSINGFVIMVKCDYPPPPKKKKKFTVYFTIFITIAGGDPCVSQQINVSFMVRKG